MINLIKADLYKLSKMSALYGGVLLCAVSAVGIAYILYGIEQGDFDIKTATNVSMLVDIMLVSLLGGVLAGGIISSDFESKNIHGEIACGKGRFSIVISKLVTLAVAVLCITLPYGIVAVVGFGMDVKFAKLVGIPSQFFDILSNVYIVENDGSAIVKAALICLLICFMYIARLSICIPVAFKFRKSIPVIIVGFISAFIFDIIAALVKDVPGVSDFISFLPYSAITKCTMKAETGDIVKVILSAVVFITAMIAITYALFRKDEIK